MIEPAEAGPFSPRAEIGPPPSPPAASEPISFLKVIEGGRATEANIVLAEFASETERLSVETPNFAGFAILVWNDEGEAETVVVRGDRNPFDIFTIAQMASDLFKMDMLDT